VSCGDGSEEGRDSGGKLETHELGVKLGQSGLALAVEDQKRTDHGGTSPDGVIPMEQFRVKDQMVCEAGLARSLCSRLPIVGCQSSKALN
jgi:hypothetical protein